MTIGTCCPASKPAVIMIGSLDADEPAIQLMQAESSVFYADGYLFFARDPTDPVLMAHRFDPETRELSGDPFPVAENVSFEGSRYVGASASENGTIVYGHERNQSVTQRLTWFDRQGNPAQPIAELGRHQGISLSPDETNLAVSQSERPPDAEDVWLLDMTLRQPFQADVKPWFRSLPSVEARRQAAGVCQRTRRHDLAPANIQPGDWR